MVNLQDYRTKIFTRSMNYELYCYAQHFITIPYERVRLTNTDADEYLYRILEDTECDIAINIDEDAFVVDERAMMDLIQFVIENDYANAGMADGGELPIRFHNPIVTNPFFNVLNVRLIRQKFSLSAVLQFDYKQHEKELMSKLPAYLIKYEKGFESMDFEPYYPFFFWLAYHFKTLYLSAQTHSDGVTTILMNHSNVPMVYHTWYSRLYNNKEDNSHTKRISSIIKEVATIRNVPVQLSFGEHMMVLCLRINKVLETKRKWWAVRLKKGPRYYMKKWLK